MAGRPLTLVFEMKGIGGAEGDRTPDLVIANDALSQLSYGPKGALPIGERFRCCNGDFYKLSQDIRPPLPQHERDETPVPLDITPA